MRRLLAILAVSAAAPGCKKDSAPASPPTTAYPRADTAELWKLVPPDALAAVVVSAGTFERLHSGVVRAAADFRKTPFGAALMAEAKEEAAALEAALAATAAETVGADLSRGAALYVLPGNIVVGLAPIADRAKLRAIAHATEDGEFDVHDGGSFYCKAHGDLYACAEKKDHFATIGAGGGSKPPTTEVGRGHIEFMLAKALVASAELPPEAEITGLGGLHGALTIEPGGATLRAHLDASVSERFQTRGAPRLLADVAKKSPGGLLSLRLGGLLGLLQSEFLEAAGKPGPFGLRPADFMASLDGDLAALVLPGEPGGELRIGIRDEAPWKKVIEGCATLMPPMFGTAAFENGRCNFSVTPPGATTVKGSAWIADKAVHLAIGDVDAKRERAALPAMAADIIEKPFMAASWGVGSLGAVEVSPYVHFLAAQLKENLDQKAQMGIWWLLHLSEWGMAIGATESGIDGIYRLRSTWSNPPAITDALEPIFLRIANGELAAIAEIRALADKHPGSPLGADVKAGVGVAIGGALFGVLAAVAIPSFVKYTKKSKASEAEHMLRRLRDAARAHELANGAPLASTPLTPDFGACCAQPNHRCAPDPALWTHPSWVALGFSIDDPHFYSYQVDTGRDGLVVRAVGDLDCDGSPSLFEAIVDDPDGYISRENETE